MPPTASQAPLGYGGYHFNWSQSEKKIARRAFDLALERDFDELVVETRRRAARIEQVDDIWELAEYIAAHRKQIDARYDYRYSVLPAVFAVLIKSGRVSISELEGLQEDKLAEIRRLAKLAL